MTALTAFLAEWNEDSRLGARRTALRDGVGVR